MNRFPALGLIGLACTLAWAPGTGLTSPGPTGQLKDAIDRVLQILEEPALKGEAQAAERHRALRRIADEIFDFHETQTARRAMEQHWRALTEAQRKEFELFGAQSGGAW